MTALDELHALPHHFSRSILVCDSSADDAQCLTGVLQSHGYIGASTLSDARHVMPHLESNRQDLVLLNTAAWAQDSLDVIQQIRRRFSAVELPILVLVNASSKEIGKAALLAGANDYLITPADPDELMLRLRSLMSIRDLHISDLATHDRLRDEVAARAAKLDMLIENGLLMAQTHERSALIRHTLFEGRRLLHCDAASMYLVTEDKTLRFVMRTRDDALASYEIALYDPDTGQPDEHHVSTWCALQKQSVLIDNVYQETRFDLSGTRRFDSHSGYRTVSLLTVPMAPRKGEVVGVLQFINKLDPITGLIIPFAPDLVPLVEALAAQAAVTLDNLQLMDSRKNLLESLIQTIATAIDAKSHYTARHSERVPELALMLAQAAHDKADGPLADFGFKTEDEWHEFRVGAWLHDCGKITTPEHVIDKATKLEMIGNRIHEVRMRFEVLLRDAEIERLQALANGADICKANATFEAQKASLMADFEFIAKSNIGVENMSQADIDRVEQIGSITWQRYFDDRLGLAQEELMRREVATAQPLPTPERLLADQPHHIVQREAGDMPDPRFGFKVDVPPYAFNHGEIYNLKVVRGTLTSEDRYKINEHMTHGIAMLERIPFPQSLQRVPEYAGTHHETLKGTGYPRRLKAHELSIPARIMMIADIFEALTAADRPYKTPKKFSEALQILYGQKIRGHIDADLFDLFLTSGVHLQYAKKFLPPDQIDEVDIKALLGPVSALH